MAYKFVQISGLGFNHSLSADTEINKYVETLRREAFKKVIDLCIKEKATALLILGDLYNENQISYDNARLIKKSFAKLKAQDIAIVYAHGKLDKGFFLDSIENDVIEMKGRYTKHAYSLPFGIDTVNFAGIGYSKRLVFQDEYLGEEASDVPSVGLMYIDKDIYTGQTLDLLHRRLEKSNMTYWAIGGVKNPAVGRHGVGYCYSGHVCPGQNDGPGCLLVTVSNKLKATTKSVDVCGAVFKKVHIDDPYRSRDIYQLLERCADLITKSKVTGYKMIVDMELSGPCTCYDQFVNHKQELQDEIAKVTETKLNININNLTKAAAIEDAESESRAAELLEKYYQLYDNEDLYDHTVNALKAKRTFYSEDSDPADKRKILEGVDSIIVESTIKEDSHDY